MAELNVCAAKAVQIKSLGSDVRVNGVQYLLMKRRRVFCMLVISGRWSVALLAEALLCSALLTACIPKGARNWPFSIGPQTYAVTLGDLDGDGDLDAYLANGENEVPVPNTVWLNDGAGHFTDSGQQIGRRESHAVLLTDLDLDGDLDAIVADVPGITLQFNNGYGVFAGNTRSLAQKDNGSYVMAPASGDLNGDGSPDVMGGGCCGEVQMGEDQPNVVHPAYDALWLNDGQGGFTLSGQKFEADGTSALALGDLDGDGDLDAFFGNSSSLMDQSEETVRNQPDTIWLNDGLGNFIRSSQKLSTEETTCLALGDLDGDRDLDAITGGRQVSSDKRASSEELVEIWLNEGGKQGGSTGVFRAGDRLTANDGCRALLLGDLDGDGDLEALVVGKDKAQIWLNHGEAGFTPGGRLAFEAQHALSLGDVDSDGDLDVFAGSVNHGILVWLNDGTGKFRKSVMETQ